MPFVAGWLITDAGLATVNGTALSGPVYLAGAAFNSSGGRYVTLFGGSVGTTDVYLNGILHDKDGRMYYVLALPSPAVVNRGMTLNNLGAVYLDKVNAAQQFVAGKGFRNNGALTVTGI